MVTVIYSLIKLAVLGGCYGGEREKIMIKIMKKSTIWLLVFLLLCGCGNRNQKEALNEVPKEVEQQSEQADDSNVRETNRGDKADQFTYNMEKETALPDGNEALADLMEEDEFVLELLYGMKGETIYRFAAFEKEEVTQRYCIQTLEAPYEQWDNVVIQAEDWVEGDKCYCIQSALADGLTENGGMVFLLRGTEDYYLALWSGDGITAQKMDRDLLNDENAGNITAMNVDGQQNIYLADGEGVLCLDNQLAAVDNWRGEDMGSICRIAVNPYDEEIYFCGNNESGAWAIWNRIEKEPVLTAENLSFDRYSAVTFASDTEGYLSNIQGIWHFSLQEGKVERLDAYSNYVQGTVSSYHIAEKQGQLSVLTSVTSNQDEKYQLRLFSPMNKVRSDVQLTLAVTVPSEFLKQAVLRFNKRNNGCQVVLRTPEKGEDFSDYRTRIQAELNSGNGPDMMAIESVVDIVDGAQKGYLMDLTEDFALHEDACLASAWEQGQVSGRCYAIPYSFQIDTVVVGRNVAGDKENWTMEQAMQCAEESEAKIFISGRDSISLFYAMGIYSETNSAIVDWDNRTSHLDSDEAKRLLEFVSAYGEKESKYGQLAAEIEEGEALAMQIFLYDASMMQFATTLFEENEVYIGYPVEDGKSGSFICGDAIAVNQATQYKEGVTEFLTWLISQEMQEYLVTPMADGGCPGFPVDREALEHVLKYLSEDTKEAGMYPSYYDGYSFYQTPLSDESIEKLRVLFDTARPRGRASEVVYDIIYEEFSGHFWGNKSAQEVLAIAQNRAQLYLDEMQ